MDRWGSSNVEARRVSGEGHDRVCEINREVLYGLARAARGNAKDIERDSIAQAGK